MMFGVISNQPHTGYGYIRASAPYRNAYSVDSFKENRMSKRREATSKTVAIIGTVGCFSLRLAGTFESWRGTGLTSLQPARSRLKAPLVTESSSDLTPRPSWRVPATLSITR